MKTNPDTDTPNGPLDELKALVSEAETLISGSTSSHSAEAFKHLQAKLDSAQKRVTEFYLGAKTKVAAGARCTDATIRNNPYRSLAIAAGIGVLVGVLVGRRTR